MFQVSLPYDDNGPGIGFALPLGTGERAVMFEVITDTWRSVPEGVRADYAIILVVVLLVHRSVRRRIM
jgi:hypothetical protein